MAKNDIPATININIAEIMIFDVSVKTYAYWAPH